MKSEILNLCDQLVAAAANGVYQGIVIAALVAFCLRFVVRTNAATRHAIWFCTLLLLAAIVVAHCLVDSSHLRRVTSSEIAPQADTDLVFPTETKAVTGNSSLYPADVLDGLSAELEGNAEPEQHPLLVALIQAQQDSVGGVIDLEEPGNTERSEAALTSHVSSGTAGFRKLMYRLLNPVSVELGSKFPRFASVIFLAFWLTLVGFRVFVLLAQLVCIQKLKRQSLPPDPELNQLFQKLSRRLVTKRKVELKVSPAHRSSFLLGFLNPVVLVPAEKSMELDETELVLRHELAHVDRRDDWVNLIQHFLLAVFFFHPAFWWISRQLSLEREIACDDHVLQQSKRPQAYALVLANLAAHMQKQLPFLAPGSSNNKTQLKERIDMILNTHRNASPRLAKTWLTIITSTAAIVTIAVICTAPRIVLAQVETTAAEATPLADVMPVVPVTETVQAVTVAGLPHPGSAESALPPSPPSPAVIGVSPKFKPGGPASLSTSPTVVTVPAVSLAPVKTRLSVTAAVPGQPAALAAIEPPSTPRPTPAPRPGKVPRSENRDSSLEERLDRLERAVNSLMSQQNPKGRSDFHLKLERDGMIDRKEIAKIEALAKQQADLARINPQEIEKIKEQAKREASRAVEQAKRATAEVEKARKANQKETVKKLKDDSQKHLEDLRKQIETLERQREKLDREIERLEQDQEKLEEQDDDSSDIDTELSESKEACVTQSHSHSHSAQ